jgi:DNA-binding NarL/FixJ family response regulator
MTHFQVNSPNVIHEIIDGEVVLINLETGSYYSIDSVGAVVWDYIGKGLSSSQIVEAIASQYNGEQATIDQGIQQLLIQLQAEQLIVPTEPPQSIGHPPPVNAAANEQTRPPFEAPVLHKYTDMEDLLLLDPIHDVDETGWPNSPEDA